MIGTLADLLQPGRLTEVVDIGANPHGEDPPYKAMLAAGACRVTGFEPQRDALAKLVAASGANERYLPHAVGDGGAHTLRLCRSPGMASLLAPDPVALEIFGALKHWGEVVDEVPVQTRRLDDIGEIERLDYLKMDIQGSELAVLRGGQEKLSRAVAAQLEVSFVPLYRGQPVFGEIDLEMRRMGFIPHCFAAVKNWPIAPCIVDGDPYKPLHQLLEADIVYVRDFSRPEAMGDEQLKHLALVAHHCYGSIDLVMRCLMLLTRRGSLAPGAGQRYAQILDGARGPR
ncbi:MAG: FkbM family methyltransferase [Lysobacter sp.]|nr:FkbM family methyltransferase [Lysobacter sp.]